ncbi:MAG: Trk system potassium transporter TrkA [Clostridia bacterium]|nr:Trk system potassium transporter TrkA [Clostridia bacterium]
MRIIIVGCGKIGTTMLSSLVDEGHDVIAIDDDPLALQKISDIYDIMCLYGNGADSDILLEADVKEADLFAAVTGSDELNMLSCFLAKRMGAKHTICRIRNPEYNDQSLSFLRQQLELSLSINPELLAAKEIFNILKLPGALNIETFSRRSFEMIELKLREDSPLVGIPLSGLRQKYKASFLVGVVRRATEIHIPDGNFVLQAGDHIGITAPSSEGERFFKMLGMLKKQARNVMILGGSHTAYYLAKMLLSIGTRVIIVEKDHARCKEFSEELHGAVIIEGDGSAQEVLLEEGLSSMDAFVALTGMDEENILISIFATAQKVPQVITKINRGALNSMASGLGLDCIISPRKIISDRVCQYVRALQSSDGGEMETLYTLMNDKVEALEFIVSESFPHKNVPLKDLSLKHNILIAGIIRGRKTLLPAGDDCIMANDHVIILAKEQRVTSLMDIFK